MLKAAYYATCEELMSASQCQYCLTAFRWNREDKHLCCSRWMYSHKGGTQTVIATIWPKLQVLMSILALNEARLINMNAKLTIPPKKMIQYRHFIRNCLNLWPQSWESARRFILSICWKINVTKITKAFAALLMINHIVSWILVDVEFVDVVCL